MSYHKFQDKFQMYANGFHLSKTQLVLVEFGSLKRLRAYTTTFFRMCF